MNIQDIFGKKEKEEVKNQSSENNESVNKDKIFNFIILDKSGSMSSIAQAAITGFNETVGGIRVAQEKFADTQEHFVSLMVFCDCEKRLIYDNVPVAKVKELTSRDYRPCCCTPLYDTMGISLTKLRKDIENIPNSTAIVTVITDGLENASKEYRGPQVKALVEDLKQLGWTFAYMGTNHNVENVANELSFENVHSFSYDAQGMGSSWDYERRAKMNYFMKIDENRRARPERTKEEYVQEMCFMARDYYEKDGEPKAERITPEHITSLQPNEIFVFGSDITGNHNGGAAMFAVQNFGAIVGQNFGMQGHSFAIPTTNVSGKQIEKCVNDFIDFAKQHAEMRFLVTPIGCGNAGIPPFLMARFFKGAKNVENIALPRIFWDNMK